MKALGNFPHIIPIFSLRVFLKALFWQQAQAPKVPKLLIYFYKKNTFIDITWPVTAVVSIPKTGIVEITVVVSTKQIPHTFCVVVAIPCPLLARATSRGMATAMPMSDASLSGHAKAGSAKTLTCVSKRVIDQIGMETRRGAEVVRQKVVPVP